MDILRAFGLRGGDSRPHYLTTQDGRRSGDGWEAPPLLRLSTPEGEHEYGTRKAR